MSDFRQPSVPTDDPPEFVSLDPRFRALGKKHLRRSSASFDFDAHRYRVVSQVSYFLYLIEDQEGNTLRVYARRTIALPPSEKAEAADVTDSVGFQSFAVQIGAV